MSRGWGQLPWAGPTMPWGVTQEIPNFGTLGPENPYEVIIADLSGTLINEVPASNLQYTDILNTGGTATFVLPLMHPKTKEALLQEGSRQVYIKYLGELVWAGYLWTIDASDVVRISCGSWLSVLALRYIDQDLTYTNTDLLDIAWDLLTFTQQKENGNLGISRYPTGPSGVLMTIAYDQFQRTPILTALSDLSKSDIGFDFEITPDKLWKPYYPRKGVNSGLVFDTEKNIQGISWTRDAQNMANAITAVGGTPVPVPKPSATRKPAGTPGQITAGKHSYVLTGIFSGVESPIGEQSGVVTNDATYTQTWVVIPPLPPGCSQLNLYRTKANADPNIITNFFRAVANVTPVSTYVDTIPDGSLSSIKPPTNTSLMVNVSDPALQPVYGLLEASTSWADVTDQARLNHHALSDLDVMKRSRDDPQIAIVTDDPPFGSYAVGDVVHIKAQKGYIDIDADYRIITIVVNVTNDGRNVITLTFDTNVGTM